MTKGNLSEVEAVGDTLLMMGSAATATEVYSLYLCRHEKSPQIHIKRALARHIAGENIQVYAEDLKRVLEVVAWDLTSIKKMVSIVCQSTFNTFPGITKIEQHFVQLLGRFA